MVLVLCCANHNIGSMWVGNRREIQVQGASSFAESIARDQVQGGMSKMLQRFLWRHHLKIWLKLVYQHAVDSTELVYPPHPISWVAQPVSKAMSPHSMAQSMAQAVSVAVPPQNMAQAMSQPVSMATLPQNIEKEMAVNLPKSNSFD
ncbi:hypothetical protein Q3G72_006849 [Acer saccharum]|nr:hypothetical protein Q3G72_006849 [Acer saccharum]